jgi:hypothetical protein
MYFDGGQISRRHRTARNIERRRGAGGGAAAATISGGGAASRRRRHQAYIISSQQHQAIAQRFQANGHPAAYRRRQQYARNDGGRNIAGIGVYGGGNVIVVWRQLPYCGAWWRSNKYIAAGVASSLLALISARRQYGVSCWLA